MIIVFFFVTVLLCCIPPIHCAPERISSTAICTESFSCPGLGPFKYPFYNATDIRCGLIKFTCTSKGGEIQIGGEPYEIVGKYDSKNNSNERFFNIVIHNETFEKLVSNNTCEALMNNFTFSSPSPLLYSISLAPFITLFKCTKNLNSFTQHKYNSYNKCKGYYFYYNYFNGTVPSDLPVTCQVLHLPVRLSTSPGLDETNISSLISSYPSILFELSTSCDNCRRNGSQCDDKDGRFQCLDIKKATEKEGKEQPPIKILVIAGPALILMLSFVIFIIWRHCKNNPFSYVSSKNKTTTLDDISVSCGISIFSNQELEDATKNFDQSHELGDGGFGAVYYGKLQDGRDVAVKKLHEHNYNRVQQFLTEVKILTKLRHPNLVVLYGCTSRQSHELLLVYEYVPNGTVFDHLHGGHAYPNLLTWPMRLNIAIETARALVYLHASEIIHRDVKTCNILLDHNFSVKVADFGLSRLITNDVTHLSTAPQGTPGYVDPQYHQRYQLTDKSDVYSFGVVLIELISSMLVVDLNRSQDEISLATFALNKIQRCAVDQLIDPNLGSDMNLEIKNMITSVAELAFRCLQYESEMRPTMNEVLDVLMDIQALGGIKGYDSSRDFKSINVMPLSDENDSVVLLKDFPPSPISFTSEWQSNNSASTTLSINGDRL